MIVHIDNPDDDRIAAFRAVRERDLVGRDGLFIAEGAVVIDRLLSSRLVEPVALLVSEAKAAGQHALIDGARDAPVYLASQAVIDAIAGFHLHRGLLALGRRRAPLSADALLDRLDGRALIVVLLGISNHDNMGGLFRNAAAFGADAVLVGEDCCDPLYRKAIRVSVGASLITPWARVAGDHVLGLLKATRFAPVALSPSGRRELHEVKPSSRTAVLLGAEGPGLPADMLAACETVRIGMAVGFDSLNVATTSGIVLHHLTRCRQTD